MKEEINNVKQTLTINDGFVDGKYKGLDLSFSSDSIEETTDKMIEFAIEIVNDYLDNKEKYEKAAINEVKERLNEEIDDSIIKKELGTPLIYIYTEMGGSIFYESVSVIGNHIPEVNIDRNLQITSVSLNG
jgi:hypothetical protein